MHKKRTFVSLFILSVAAGVNKIVAITVLVEKSCKHLFLSSNHEQRLMLESWFTNLETCIRAHSLSHCGSLHVPVQHTKYLIQYIGLV